MSNDGAVSEKQQKQIPYGLWPSPLTATHVSQGKRLEAVQWSRDGRTLVWLEGRSDHSVLVATKLDGSASRDLTVEHSVRARVGYGGGDYCVGSDAVYYVNQDDQRLYRLPLEHGLAMAITPEFGKVASPTLSPNERYLIYVHSYEGQDCLAMVDAAGDQWPQQLASGADFYMQPAWSPDGQHVAWIEWDHPHMPWDETRLVLAQLDNASPLPRILKRQVFATTGVAYSEPLFTPDRRYLLFLSDADNWSNLYRYDLDSGEAPDHGVTAITQDKAEIRQPAWAQGMRHYVYHADSKQIIYLRSRQGRSDLWSVSLTGNSPKPLATPLASYATHLSALALAPSGDWLAVIASAPDSPPRVMSAKLDGSGAARIHGRSSSERIAPAYFSAPEVVSWTATDGGNVYGLYYAPHHPDHMGDGKPPCIVLVHGGPTSQETMAFSARVQFFTTRGYGVLAVNYRGSAGYGKAYMRALRGQWGVLDVEDATGGAQHLATLGKVDPKRLVIMGGSAGGLTVLLTLINHPGLFRAGICAYGVSNLFELAKDTHKFEAHYPDSLIGPLPQAADLYRARSPFYHADRIADPILLFQGADDRVVPRQQSDTVVDVLVRNKVPHAYHVYEGEGHGWRKSETIKHYYETILSFLERHVLYV